MARTPGFLVYARANGFKGSGASFTAENIQTGFKEAGTSSN
jgi:hypothetical protein